METKLLERKMFCHFFNAFFSIKLVTHIYLCYCPDASLCSYVVVLVPEMSYYVLALLEVV